MPLPPFKRLPITAAVPPQRFHWIRTFGPGAFVVGAVLFGLFSAPWNLGLHRNNARIILVPARANTAVGGRGLPEEATLPKVADGPAASARSGNAPAGPAGAGAWSSRLLSGGGTVQIASMWLEGVKDESVTAAPSERGPETSFTGDQAWFGGRAAAVNPVPNVAATTATWTGGGTDGNWSTTGNWNAAVPGVVGTTNDTSTANFDGVVANTTATLDQSYNLQNINFGVSATTLASYTINASNGSSLLLTSGGAIQFGSVVTASTGLTQTISAPIVLEPGSATTIGTYRFANNNATASNVLSITGNVSGGTTSFTNGSDNAPDGGAVVLTLTGTNTGLNTVSGVISNGGAGSNNQQGLAIQKTGTGTWYLTGANTFTGALQVTQGILNVASLSDYGVASAIGARAAGVDAAVNGGIGLLINGGTLQYTGSTPQSTNRNIRLGTNGTNNNFIDASGSNVNATLSFTHTGANVNLFQASANNGITLTGTNTGLNTFNISLGTSGATSNTVNTGGGLIKTGTGTWVIAPVASANGSSYTGGTFINAGTLIAGAGDFNSTFGVFGGSSRTVNLGDITGTANASLLNAGFSVGEAINVRAGSTGVMTIGSSTTTPGTFSGNVTLNNGVTLQGFTGGQINLSGVISGGQPVSVGSTGNTGVVNLSNVNTYTGATNVNFGTLQVSGTGSINTTSGITVNGSTAEYLQTSTVASTRAITLTTGILDGTGTVGAVTVGAGTGGIVQNGNGTSATLTLGSLTFSGNATANLIESSTASTTVGRLNVTGALSAAGTVTLNLSGTFANGANDLISYGSFTTGSLANFTLGTVTGLNSRQAVGGLSQSGNNIILTINGDSPKWTGLDGGNWQTGTTGPNSNWRLITGGTPTDFLTNDTVLFDDTATGTTALNIASANVSVSGATFNNSSLTYSVSSAGGYGITGAGALTKSGSGTVALNTANTYTGGTFLNAGTLQVGNATALGTAANAALTFGAGSTGRLQLNANSITLTDLNTNATNVGTPVIENGTAGASTLTVNTVNSDTYAGVLQDGAAGTLALTTGGAGTLALSGANTYTGGTNINGGTVNIGNASALGTTGTISFGGGTLQYAAGITTDVSARFGTVAQAYSIDTNSNNVTYASAFGGGTSNTLTKAGAGTLTLTAAETYTGTTTINGGVLQLGNGGTTGSLATGSAISDNGNLTFNRSNAVAQGTDFSGAAISGTGSVTQAGSGTTTLNAANSYTGGTTVIAGTLVAASGTALGANAAASKVNVASGATLNLQSPGSFNYAYTFSGSGLLKVSTPNGGSDTVINNFGVFSGTLEIATSGNNKLQIQTATPTNLSTATLLIDNGAQYFTGGNVNFGTINVQGTGNGEGRGAIRLNGNGTTTGVIGGNVFLQGSTTIGNEGGVLTGNISNFAGTVGTQTLTMGGVQGGTALLSGILSDGSGTLALTQANGTTTLAGTNTYTGATMITGGKLVLTNALAVQNSPVTNNVANGVVFDASVTGNAFTFGGLAGTGNIPLQNNAGTPAAVALTVGGSSGNYSGILSGPGSLTQNGPGTTTLSGANTYTGATTINQGTLAFGANASIPLANLTFGGTGALGLGDVNGAHDLTLTAPITGTTSANAIVGNASVNSTVTLNGTGTQTYANAFGGTGANNNNLNLVAGATGSTANSILNATSTYTGTTTINGGTLTLAKAGAGPDPNNGFLTTGGTLAGTSGLTVNTGGTLVLGASNTINSGPATSGQGLGTGVTLSGGMLTLVSGVTQGHGVNVVNGASDGNSFDVPGLGNLTLTAASALTFAGGSGTVVFNGLTLNGNALSIGGTHFTTTTGNSADGVTDRFINDGALTSGDLALITFTNYLNSPATEIDLGDGFFEIIPLNPVPEPGTWVGLLLGAGALCMYRKSRGFVGRRAEGVE